MPVFVDVDPATLTMDLDAMRGAVTPRTRAILPVDLFGHPAAMPEIMAFAAQKGLAVIEDACLALGATVDGRHVGTLADVTCFSFAPTKHLGSLGSGGACVTADAALAERMQKIAAYGQSRARHMSGAAQTLLHHETEGLNERLDEIQAAVLRVKLGDVPASLAARRRQLPSTLRRWRAPGSLAPSPPPGSSTPSATTLCISTGATAFGPIWRRAASRPPSPMPRRCTSTRPSPISATAAARSRCRSDRATADGSAIGPHLDDRHIAEVAEGIRAVL